MNILRVIKKPFFYFNIMRKKLIIALLARTNPRKLASLLYSEVMGGGKN